VNSFVASISSSGGINWKRYPENSNEGVAVIHDEDGLVFLLNRNCYIVNTLSESDGSGSEAGRIRAFLVCDSYDTGAEADSFDFNYAGNILLAGTRSGSYYLLIKPVGDN
jgi:hypothetical protein